MNIFSKGLNFLKDTFFREQEDVERISTPVQVPYFGFFSNQKKDKAFNTEPTIERKELDIEKIKGTEVTKFAREIARAPFKAVTGLGLQLKGEDSFIPETPMQKFVLGKEPIFKTEKQGEDFLKGITRAEDVTRPQSLVAGLSLVVLDTAFGGKSKSAKLIAKSDDIDEIFNFVKKVMPNRTDKQLTNIADDLINITDSKKVEEYIRNVDKIEDSVIKILDSKTGKTSYKTIPKGELDDFKSLIGDTEKGIAGHDIDGKIYDIVKKTTGQMKKIGGEYDGIAKLEDISSNKIFEAKGKAYNINLDKLDMTDSQKNAYIARVERIKPQLESIRGKKMSNNEVLDAAKESDLMRKVQTRQETLDQIAEVTKARQRNVELSGLIEATDNIPRKAKLIQEQLELTKVLGSQAADAGRKLQAFNIQAEGVDGVRLNILKRLNKITKDTEGLAKKAAKVDWNDQNSINSFYREYVKPSTKELFDEYRYNNMLSNPRTFERNLISSLFSSAIIRPSTKFVEAGIDAFIAPLTGKQREVFFKEVPEYYKGFFGSIPQALDNFINVWKGTNEIANKDLQSIIGRGAMESFLKYKLKLSDKTARRVATTFNIPTKALESVDQMLMKMVSEGELASLRKRGMGELEAVKEANRIAEYSLFRLGLDPVNKTEQGLLLSKIDRAITGIESMRKNVPLMDWFVPFVKTPMNFAKQWIEYSPAGLFTIPGNTNKKTQIAKLMIGSSIAGLTAQKAFNDETTWGVPSDQKERELFFASGRKPYSVKIGDNWVPMMYLGPWAYALALPAALKYYQEDNNKALTDTQTEKIAKAIGSMGELLSQQTFLEGVGNFVDTLKADPNQSIEKTLAFTAGQTVPWQGLNRYISTVIDDVYRKSDSFSEAMQKDLPFLSKNLEPYRMPTGEESTRNMSSYIAPYDITKEKEEYTALLEQRKEQLQINNLLKENDTNINKESLKIVDTITNAKTKKELITVMEKIKDNEQLKNTVTGLLKKQAMYTAATLEPLQMFRNDPSAIAEIIYGRILMADNKQKLKEDVIEYIEELKENGLYDDSVKGALNRLILKESEQEELEKQIEESEE